MEESSGNHPVGRPTKYLSKYAELAEKLCQAHGYTDEQLAELLGVAVSTLNLWKQKHQEFSESIERGKSLFDSEAVESALLKRAKGFVRKRLTKRTFARAGVQTTETTETVEEVAGSVRAQEVWLYNRNPERWKRVPSAGEPGAEGESEESGVLIVPQKEDWDEWLSKHTLPEDAE